MVDIKDNIVLVDIEKLKPYKNNPKLHPPEQIKKIANSMNNYGFTQPIVITHDNQIIIGHGRVEAGKLLNMEKVPAIKRDDLTEEQVRALRIADNKVAESGWDLEALSEELEILEMSNLDIEDLTAFTVNEVEEIRAEIEKEKEKEENRYSQKIESPTYEITGVEPLIENLYDDEKAQSLIEKIKASGLERKQKEFLILTAYRQIRFDYESIAEYYAHAGEEMQELMEDLALVIIDMDKAIEQGFTDFCEETLKGVVEDEE